MSLMMVKRGPQLVQLLLVSNTYIIR